jgi:hypothetical protein
VSNGKASASCSLLFLGETVAFEVNLEFMSRLNWIACPLVLGTTDIAVLDFVNGKREIKATTQTALFPAGFSGSENDESSANLLSSLRT